jgi:hypothetical protein
LPSDLEDQYASDDSRLRGKKRQRKTAAKKIAKENDETTDATPVRKRGRPPASAKKLTRKD